MLDAVIWHERHVSELASGMRRMLQLAGGRMKTPLLDIQIPSVYKNKQGAPVPLPPRLARATPDMAAAIAAVASDVTALGGRLVLSDLFRSYEMQLQAHLDFVNKKKSAFSPPPGGSFHEAGRAMDISLADLKMSLMNFWPIAKKRGLVPIINAPDSTVNEAWHFECRGSHQRVVDYYQAQNGDNFDHPYAAGAASAILALGIRVDKFGTAQKEAQLQAALIRCGELIGNLDGAIGAKTRAALAKLQIDGANLDDALAHVEDVAQKMFVVEYVLPAAAVPVIASEFAMQIPEHLDLHA